MEKFSTSFQHWFIFTIRHLVSLSLWKALNFIQTSNWRGNVKLEKQRRTSRFKITVNLNLYLWFLVYVYIYIYIYIYKLYIILYIYVYIYICFRMLKYMSCHKAIAVITERVHCFHDNIYIYIYIYIYYIIYICIYIYICFRMYLSILLMHMTLFLCHFVRPCEVSEGTVSLCLCQFFYLSACLCAVVWPFNFTERFGYDNSNLVLTVISSNTFK